MGNHIMRRIAASIMLVLCSVASARADYVIPIAEEQLVVLVKASELRFTEKNRLAIATLDRDINFPISTFWMQHHIDSNLICTGGTNSLHPRSAKSRLLDIQNRAGDDSTHDILIGLVRTKGEDNFTVSYMKVLDADADLKRYLKEKRIDENFRIEFDSEPQSAEEALTMLRRKTGEAFERLKRPERVTRQEMR